jgi:polyhydroxyalkanoate synthesis regulator phasin
MSLRAGIVARFFSDSILGTSSFSAEFVRDLRQEMATAESERKGAPRDMYLNCIRKGELGHMESPEADEKAKKKLDRMADDLFARLPTPKDPMKVALEKTPEERADEFDLDALKEEVRARYRRNLRRRTMESSRIDDAMDEVTKGTHRMMQDGPGMESLVDMGDVPLSKPSPVEAREAELQAEISAMKKRVEELERQVAAGRRDKDQ